MAQNLPAPSASVFSVDDQQASSTASSSGDKTAEQPRRTASPVNLLEGEASEVPEEPLPPGLRLVIISDTHGKHRAIAKMPRGDVLIHAGDFTSTGTVEDVVGFTNWFDEQEYDHRVYIAGNHDTSLDADYYCDRGHARFHSYRSREPTVTAEQLSAFCVNQVRSSSSTYLQDEKVVFNVRTSDDAGALYPLRIYGSPWSPEFCDWAFNLERGQPCLDKWSLIAPDTDVLVTHGPPLGYGDKTETGFRCGCEDLLAEVRGRETPPRVHIFGHIHEDRGAWHDGSTIFVNASTCTFSYRPTNAPIVVHLPLDPRLPARVIRE